MILLVALEESEPVALAEREDSARSAVQMDWKAERATYEKKCVSDCGHIILVFFGR